MERSNKLLKKIFLLLALFSTFFLITSCSNKDEKDIVYCFSTVFDVINDVPQVTLYCKSQQSSSDSTKENEENLKLIFSGNTFKQALDNADKTDNEIYYNSTKCFFFGEALSDKQINEIALILLNETKYQAGAYVYVPSDNESVANYSLYDIAEEICQKGKYSSTEKEKYISAIKFLRNKSNNETLRGNQ